MALVSKCVVTKPSSFEEDVEDPVWVDAMVEEYDSIVRNNAWEIVPRPEGKSVVGLLHSNLSPSLPFPVPHIGGPIL